jgi:hypothetical protein
MSNQQKLLLICAQLIPLGMFLAWPLPSLFYDPIESDDAGPGVFAVGGFLVSLAGMLGVFFCAIIWRWDSPDR